MPGGRNVLYLTHNGLTEPLGRRQVLPYLIGLSARGWSFTVVSFEKASTATPEAISRVEKLVEDAGIRWLRRTYHNRPPLLSTALNVLQGIGVGLRVMPELSFVHARSTVPSFMARHIARTRGVPWIFDLRGLLAQEYVDAGHWRADGWKASGVARLERRLLGKADAIVTLTHAVQPLLPPTEVPKAVVPCCVDTTEFRPSKADREAVRSELGFGACPVLVYSGSLGSWYRLGEMLDFHSVARRHLPDLRFLILTPHRPAAMAAIARRGLADSVVALTVPPDAVPRHLAAADVGICFLGRHESKVASSPTKYGEYLASGLPVVTNDWVGDARRLAGESAWLLVDEFSSIAYERSACLLPALLSSGTATREAARGLARREFALEVAVGRYDDLYRKLAA